MTRQEAFTRLQAIFRDVLGAEAIALGEATTAQDVDGWDSLTHVDLIAATEGGFGITLTTREAKKLRNVGDLVDLILKKVPPGASA